MGLFPWVSKQSLEVHFLLAVRACLLLPYHAPPADAELVKSKVEVKVKSSWSFFFFVEKLFSSQKHHSYGKLFLYVPLAQECKSWLSGLYMYNKLPEHIGQLSWLRIQVLAVQSVCPFCRLRTVCRGQLYSLTTHCTHVFGQFRLGQRLS